MRAHAQSFKGNIVKLGRQINARITYIDNGETITIREDDIQGVSPIVNGNILRSIMKELDFEMSYELPIGLELSVELGVYNDDTNEYEYISYGKFYITEREYNEDTLSYDYTCYDLLVKSMKINEALDIVYPITVRDYMTALFNKLGIEFKNKDDTFVNYDKVIQTELYAGLGQFLYRDILDDLAQTTASTICIDEATNEAEVRYITETNEIINGDFLKDANIKFNQKFGPVNTITLTRSGGADSIYIEDTESVEINGRCEIKIEDNQIMNWGDRGDYLQSIFDELNGLEYYINDFSSTGIGFLELCDRYTIELATNSYSCVMLNDEMHITSGIEENIFTELPDAAVTDYERADKADRDFRNLSLIVDYQGEQITSIAERVVILSETKNSFSLVQITNANNNGLHELIITGNIKPTYPNPELFPSPTIYLKNTKLIVTANGEETEYKLPLPQLNILGDVTDKFKWQQGNMSFEQNIGVNEDGTLFILDEPIITGLGFLDIFIPQGNCIIRLYSFTDAMFEATYLLQNSYTDTFATKVELASEINQTAEKISLKVSKNEIISEINQTAEEIQINANKISLAGKQINLTSENVKIVSSNFNVDEQGNMSCNNANIGGTINSNSGAIGGWIINSEGLTNGTNFIRSNGYSSIYTYADMVIIRNYLEGKITLDATDIKHYDLNNDGVVNSADLLIMRQRILGA